MRSQQRAADVCSILSPPIILSAEPHLQPLACGVVDRAIFLAVFPVILLQAFAGLQNSVITERTMPFCAILLLL